MAIVHTCERCGEVCKDSAEKSTKYAVITADVGLYVRTVDLCESCSTLLNDWMDLKQHVSQVLKEKEPPRKKKWWRKKR